MALTAKQRLFIAAYLETWNASEAARRAGYSGARANQAGQDYLSKPDIAAAIESHLAAIMPAGEVLTRIAARARASIADVLALPITDPPSEPEKGLAKLTRGDWSLDLDKAQRTGGVHQIKKLKSGKYGDEVETYDPLPALELLAKYHGILVERHEHSGPDGGPIEIDDARERLADKLTRRLTASDPDAGAGGDSGAEPA